MSKLDDYETKLSELRIKWKSADSTGKRIIEQQARFIKKSIEVYQTASPEYKYSLELFK